MYAWIIPLSLLLATPIYAIPIVLEPDDYAVGTDVTNLFEGVTLQRYNGAQTSGAGPSFAPVVIPSSSLNTPATGTQAFGDFHGTVEATTCWTVGFCGGFSVLLVQFAQPTNYVEVASSWGIREGGDDQTAYAFDANRQLIQFARTEAGDYLRYVPLSQAPPGVNDSDFASIVRLGSMDGAPLIHSVILGGWDTTNTTDRIRYNSVPEPSSLLLAGLGLGMLVFASRVIHRHI